jgi:diguanylate cyclase
LKFSSTPALQSRVGKRVLILVLAAALIPLAALVGLLEVQVSALLLEQGGRRIASAAKVYAFGVFDRLLIARETARHAEPAREGVPPPLAARHFRWLATVGSDGKVKPLIGQPDEGGIKWAASLARDKWASPSKLNASEMRMLMAQPAPAPADGILVGLLNGAFLWGEDDELPAGMTPCVLVQTAALHCPLRFATNALTTLDATRGKLKPERITAPQTNSHFLATAWPLFMRNEFGADDWTFAVLADEGELLGSLHTFRYALAAVVVLSVLLSFLISMRHVTSILGPLSLLTARTRRISGRDFAGHTAVESHDEFEELGDALNTMSEELRRQFQLADAHAYIDREILARSPLDRVLSAALTRLNQLVPAATIGLIVFERQTSNAAHRVSILNEGLSPAEEPARINRIELDPGARADLQSLRTCDVTPASAPAFMRDLLPTGAAAILLQPVVWGNAGCGVLIVEASAGKPLDEEQRRIVAEFADHIAVATSSSWRDEALYFQAHHDALTQLPNRLLFRERLEREIARSERAESELAVLFVDLDHFKAINDTQGHGAGDQLLRVAAERIRSAVRESDTVARYGGDEFTVLLAGLHDHNNALRVARKIVEALSVPFKVAGVDSFLSASVGISVFPNDGRDADALLRNADLAMYRAKVAGRGQCLFFEAQMNAEAVARFALDREMRTAVDRAEYELFYQPQVDTGTGKVVAAEALVRWRHPVRGLLTPAHFIPAAEAGGAIRDIGAWVLREACSQLRAWRDAGIALERLSVNVSARQLARDDFVDLVESCIADNVQPLPIELEITESVMLEHTVALRDRLNRLTAMGCTIALDDFGTAFSSMSYLKRLPVHCVKIDREFVMDLERDDDSRTFVDAIVRMSHALGKRVVAEGVETAAQAELLRELDCDYLQGYFHSMPLPAALFQRFVEERNRLPSQAAASN